VAFASHPAKVSPDDGGKFGIAVSWLEARCNFTTSEEFGDFGKLALLRHLMEDRRLAVCCYPAAGKYEAKDRERHFGYLKRPEDFPSLRSGGV